MPNLFSSELNVDARTNSLNTYKEIKKVWGSEFIEVIDGDNDDNERMSVIPLHKFMILKRDFQCSLHYHLNKTEKFILLAGRMNVEIINSECETIIYELTEMSDSVTIPCGVPHKFYCPEDATEDAIFLEIADKWFDDTEDSYRLSKSGPTDETTYINW